MDYAQTLLWWGFSSWFISHLIVFQARKNYVCFCCQLYREPPNKHLTWEFFIKAILAELLSLGLLACYGFLEAFKDKYVCLIVGYLISLFTTGIEFDKKTEPYYDGKCAIYDNTQEKNQIGEKTTVILQKMTQVIEIFFFLLWLGALVAGFVWRFLIGA